MKNHKTVANGLAEAERRSIFELTPEDVIALQLEPATEAHQP